MTVDKAVRVLQCYNRYVLPGLSPDEEEAIKLLIEAGKREVYHRSCYPGQSPSLLPGETTD